MGVTMATRLPLSLAILLPEKTVIWRRPAPVELTRDSTLSRLGYGTDALDPRGFGTLEMDVLVGDHLELAAHGVEELAFAQQKIGAGRLAVTFVADRECLVQQHPARC